MEEIPKEESTTKKVYLTPGEFIWDNYKRGKITMKKEEQLEMDLGPEDTKIRIALRDSEDKKIEEDYLINEKLREHELAGKMIGALYKLREDGKLDARSKKTLLKNINNLAKSIRNINRILKEVL